MIRRLFIALVVVAAASFSVVGVAGAGYNPPETITCVPQNAVAGDTVTCTASCFEPGTTVDFTFNGTDVGSAVADENCTAVLQFTLPADTPPGTFVICASGLEFGGLNTIGIGTTIQVGVVTITTLPVTGSDSQSLTQVAAVLIAVGALFLLVAKRRTAEPAEIRA